MSGKVIVRERTCPGNDLSRKRLVRESDCLGNVCKALNISLLDWYAVKNAIMFDKNFHPKGESAHCTSIRAGAD